MKIFSITRAKILPVKCDTVKSLLEAHALIEAHSPVWTPKMPIFQAFPKNQVSIKGQPTNIEKKIGPMLCRNIVNLLLAANF